MSPIKVGIRKKSAAFNGKVIDKRRMNEDESFEDYFVDQDEEKIPVQRNGIGIATVITSDGNQLDPNGKACCW